jgi:hypothetical protein
MGAAAHDSGSSDGVGLVVYKGSPKLSLVFTSSTYAMKIALLQHLITLAFAVGARSQDYEAVWSTVNCSRCVTYFQADARLSDHPKHDAKLDVLLHWGAMCSLRGPPRLQQH